MKHSFTMKKVVILALKDKEGNFYACSSNFENSLHGNITRLYKEQPAEASVVEIFPFTSFSSFSTQDQSQYEFIYLQALVELSDKEVDEFCSGDCTKYNFYRRKVQAVKELETPFEYIWEVMTSRMKMEKYTQASNIRYEALSWHYLFGFKSENEFKIYLKLLNFKHPAYIFSMDYEFAPTRFNKEYLEKVLLEDSINLDLYRGRGNDVFSLDEKEFFQKVDSLPFEALANFHRHTFMRHLQKTNQNRVTKELFDTVIKKGGWGIVRFIPKMTEKVILEYGADYLLQKVFPELRYMLNDSNYEPEIEIDYEYDEPIRCLFDDRDDEMEFLSPILPYATEKSLPLLRKLVLEKIKSYLPNDIKEKLIAS